MKNIISKRLLTFLLVTFLFSLVSCHKDGVYNPKRKITKLYHQPVNGEKYCYQEWNWNGKLLESIVHLLPSGASNAITKYYYENDRIKEIRDYGRSILFSYDKSHIEKVEVFYGGKLETEIRFFHTKNKITKIEFTEFDSKSNAAHLQGLFSLHTFDNIQNFYENRDIKDNKAVTFWSIEYIYEGNNVFQEKYIEGNLISIYTFKYDKKINPFYHLLYGSDSFTYIDVSKNNIVSITYSDNAGSESYDRIFTYTYDKQDYPISSKYKNMKNQYESGTTFYEYLQ